MRTKSAILIIWWLISACAADDHAAAGFELFSTSYDFSASQHGWEHGFSDYPLGDSAFYELSFAHADNPFDGKKSLMLSGNNRGDELFMYLKKKVDGLAPNTIYTITFEVTLVSNAQAGAVGAPGENVYLKVGGSATEPLTVRQENFHQLNLDHGLKSNDGQHMVVIGNIAVTEFADGWGQVTRSNSSMSANTFYDKPVNAKTNSQGELWLIVGTDSAYKGTTTVYYSNITIVMSKSA